MKKFLFTLLLIMLMGSSINQVFAEEIKYEAASAQEILDENDIQQEEIDRRLGIVFEYLNEHANREDFSGRTSVSFEIPVDEGVIVHAEISNQEFLEPGTIGMSKVGSDTYSIKANTTYNYNLTLKNVVGNGDTTVYTVNYTVGNPIAPGKDQYNLTVNSVSISGTPPSGYNSGSSSTWIGYPNGGVIVNTGGYIKYTRLILADKTINFNNVTFGSVMGSKLQVDYWYSVD